MLVVIVVVVLPVDGSVSLVTVFVVFVLWSVAVFVVDAALFEAASGVLPLLTASLTVSALTPTVPAPKATTAAAPAATNILLSLTIFMIIPPFLRSKVISMSTTTD